MLLLMSRPTHRTHSALAYVQSHKSETESNEWKYHETLTLQLRFTTQIHQRLLDSQWLDRI